MLMSAIAGQMAEPNWLNIFRKPREKIEVNSNILFFLRKPMASLYLIYIKVYK